MTRPAPLTRSIAPPMPLTIDAGHHPVGQVAVAGDLHTAEDGDVDMAAADHREAGGRVEVRRAGEHRDRLLARVDQVRVDLVVVGERARRPGCRSRRAG